MTETLAGILGVAESWLNVGFLVLLRIGAAMAFLPGLSERSVPLRVRAALTLAICIVALPLVPMPEVTGRSFSALAAQEVAAGLFFGLLFRTSVFVLQTAGTIIGQSISVAQLFGGTSGEPTPVVGNLLMAAGLALFALADLHVYVVEILVRSYDVLPMGMRAAPGDLAGTLVSRGGHALALALSLSAPFVAAALLYNLALGVINRAMPQLMVTFVGAPALSLLGILLLFLSLPLVLSHWLAVSADLTELP